ncbi:MAG: hypothetical protein QXF90_08310 [Thermofilaceae archaeon]
MEHGIGDELSGRIEGSLEKVNGLSFEWSYFLLLARMTKSTATARTASAAAISSRLFKPRNRWFPA